MRVKNGARIYGAWAGNPKGRAEDPSCCVKEVCTDSRAMMNGQCSRKRGHGPGGLYCTQHDPANVKQREEEKSARWKAKMDRHMAPYDAAEKATANATLWRKRAVELAEAVNRGDEARVTDLQIRAILDADKDNPESGQEPSKEEK